MVSSKREEVISIGIVRSSKSGFTIEFQDNNGHSYKMPLECCKCDIAIDRNATSVLVLLLTEYSTEGVKPTVKRVLGTTFD